MRFNVASSSIELRGVFSTRRSYVCELFVIEPSNSVVRFNIFGFAACAFCVCVCVCVCHSIHCIQLQIIIARFYRIFSLLLCTCFGFGCFFISPLLSILLAILHPDLNLSSFHFDTEI